MLCVEEVANSRVSMEKYWSAWYIVVYDVKIYAKALSEVTVYFSTMLYNIFALIRP